MVTQLSKQLDLSPEKTRECFVAFLKQLHFITYKEKYLPTTLVSLFYELGNDGVLNYWGIVENIIRKAGADEDFIMDWSHRLGNLLAYDFDLQEYFEEIKRQFDSME